VLFGYGINGHSKECIRHTKERYCIITNINADRVTYHEVSQTPLLTPVSSHSLPLPIQELSQSQLRESTSRRLSPSRLAESRELTEFQRIPKVKERKGEGKDSVYNIQIFFPGGRCDEVVYALRMM